MRKFARVGRPSQPLGEQRADLGERERRRVRAARPPRATTSSSSRCSSARCHASRPAVAVSASAAAAIAAAQPPIGCGRRSASSAALQPVDQLGEPAGEVDRAALDVVERQHAAEQPLLLLGHRRRRAARGPGPARHVPAASFVELERRAVGGVEPPADARCGDPLLHPREVVVVEAEAAADRARGRRGRAPGRRSGAGRRARAAARRRRAPGWSGAASGRRAGRAGRAGAAPRAGPRARRPRARSRRRRTSRWISGANVSMSGHITITSRGSSVGSSASRCRIASRSTSTWRARPWQACTWMLRSASSSRSSGRPGSGGPATGGRRARRPGCARAASPVGGGDRVVVVGVRRRAGEHELQLARVLPPGGEQPVGRERARRRRRRGGRSAAPPATRSHSAGEGCSRNRWTSRWRAERPQHLQPAGGQPRQAEERQARRGSVDEPRLLAQARARRLEPLGRVGLRRCARAAAATAPPASARRRQLAPRRRRRARRPRASARPVERVAVEQLGDVAHAREPPRLAGRVGSSPASRRGGRRALRSHGSCRDVVDDLQQRPHQPLGQPRVGVGLDPGRDGDRARRPAAAETGTRRSRTPRRRGRRSRRARSRAAGSASAPCRAWAPRSTSGANGSASGSASSAARAPDEPVGALGSVDVQHGRSHIRAAPRRSRPPRLRQLSR